MRTLELLRALSDKELTRVSGQIGQQKRKTLANLLTELKKYIKQSGNPANEDLFQKVFGKPYSSDKNYLLRNELRLLNDFLYDYLIIETFQAYIRKHKSTYYYWLARTMFDRKLNNAFDAEIDRFIDYAKDYIKPEDGALLADLRSLWMIYYQPKTIENLEAQLAAVDNWKDEEIRHLRYRLREAEARQAYIEYSILNVNGKERQSGDERTKPFTTVDLTPKADDQFEQYMLLKKYSFQTSGLPRIEVLKEKLKIEEGDDYKNEFSDIAARIGTCNNLATEYILLGDFESGNEYLLKCIVLSEENRIPVLSSTLQNFMGNQLNLRRYQDGIEFYRRYEELIKSTRQYISISIYNAYCYLFLREDDAALKALPEDNQLTDHQHLMYRMVYLLAFIIRGQFELAINECRNIARMVRNYEGELFAKYEWITALFLKYLNAVIKEREPRKAELAKLKEELKSEQDRVSKLVITEFAFRWLVEELEKMK